MILEGPLAPKLKAEAFVTSENVGEGGPGEVCVREVPKARARRERGWVEGMVGMEDEDK